MATIIDCPACRKQLRVPPDLLGQRVKCPECGVNFDAAQAPAPPPPPPIPPPLPPRHEEPRRRELFDDPSPRVRSRRPRDLREDREEFEDEAERRVRRRPGEKPGKVQAIAVMTLVGGILGTMNAAGLLLGVGLSTFGLCCLWPGFYYGLVVGIMAIVKGSQLLGQDDYRQPPPRGIAIMQIINIINLDVPNCVMGIITLVFLGDPEVSDYYRG